MAKIVFSDSFNRALAEIEDYIFSTTDDVEMVERFLDELDRVLGFVSHNLNTPSRRRLAHLFDAYY